MSNDSYIFQKQIGKGGQGVVYLAWDCNLNKQVCIKKTPIHLYEEKRGIYLMGKVNHPNFPKTLNTYEDDCYFYHVMEYISGASLLSCYHKLNTARTIQVGLQLLEMIHYLNNEHLTLNDIKPYNIIVTKTKDVYLIDYGAVLSIDDQFSVRYGSIAFCSPEYISKKKIDWSSDLYSVGKVLKYVCKRPNRRLDEWIKKATKHEVKERFQTIFEAFECLKPRRLTYLLLILVLISYIAKPYLIQNVIHCFHFQNEQNTILFHSLNIYDQLQENQRLIFSNRIMAYQNEIYWTVQESLLVDSKNKELQDRYLFLKNKSIVDATITKENLYFYIYFLCYQKDTQGLQSIYNHLKNISKKELYIEDCMIEIAFYLQEESLLYEQLSYVSKVSKAKGLYRLFQLGNYDKGCLHQALELLEDTDEVELKMLIQMEINQWGDES